MGAHRVDRHSATVVQIFAAPFRAPERRPRRAPRAALLWGGICFCLLQVLLVAWGDFVQPTIYDPEFALHLGRLKARRAEHPEQSLLMLIGSSRMTSGFRPERLLPLATANGEAVMPFNFAHAAAGPVYMLLTFQRLVREGHTPRWLVVEIMPLLLRENYDPVYATSVVAGELAFVSPYAARAALYKGYVKNRLVPWQKHGQTFLLLNFPRLRPESSYGLFSLNLDRLGGWPQQSAANADPAVPRRLIRDGLARNGMLFPDSFRVDPQADAALRRLLGECRARGIRTALLLAPESPEFQRHYSSMAVQQIQEYAGMLCAEFAADCVDAQRWLPEEDFLDGHHMNLSGQTHFTDRLGEEFLHEWVRRD